MLKCQESYGKILYPERINRAASNITELWETAEMRNLRTLWSMTEGRGASLNSDYEKFRALCDMMPQLDGHPVKRYCGDFLKRYFSCDFLPDAAHCDAIWRLTSDALLVHPLSVGDLLELSAKKQYLLWTEATMPHNQPRNVLPELVADHLFTQPVSDVKRWMSDAEEMADSFSLCGCDRVFFVLPDAFDFNAPDPYHVSQALSKKSRTAAECDLLLSQLFRMMCEICLARGWGMHFRVGACADAATQLLAYAERTVGLPPIYWSTAVPSTRDRLLVFTYLKHQNLVLPMLCLSDYPSDGELQAALSAYAARYPIGMLHCTLGGDLRMWDAEQDRLNRIILEREKIYDQIDRCRF